DGMISSIADSINEKADLVINEPGLHASIGWMDIFSNFCDPGYEYKETLESGAMAAAAGGFTDVLVLPNSNPAVHNKSQVEYILQRSAVLPVNLLPIGSVTKNTEGKELAEMYDMKQSGAVAFSDGINALQSPGILLKALQYVQAFDGTIIQMPDDKSIGTHGLINEGIISTQLGLPGKPAIAEELMIARDIELLRYSGSKLHITAVSTAKGIELINNAKKEGLHISCSVTPYHVLFCDEDLVTYDTNLKVNPPLRSRADMMAIQQALLNGSIDCIASHHLPQNWDNKICEFEYAKYGMIGLQTMFSAMMSIGLPVGDFVQMQTTAARNIFGIVSPPLEEHQKACITLFDPAKDFLFEEKDIQSRSKNSPFISKMLRGKVKGIINGTKQQFF
ncbi:MAG: dihydroorotase, partial [Ferruginibacter sp.]